MSTQFLKQPAETYTVAIEYAGKLPSGATIVSGTVAAVRLDTGATDNTVLASTTATISGTQVRAKVQAGTDGLDYRLTFAVTLSTGDLLEDDLVMKVKNL
jgi:hypothetical protein